MRIESDHVRLTTEPGTATLWLNFPGEPVNVFDLVRLRELDRAITAVAANPAINILVLRSAKPAGFCAGIHPDALASLTTEADRAAFAWVGQQVFGRLAGLDAVSVAFIDGPCLGAGLELALACDYRLTLSRPTTLLGFPDAPHGIRPCFGGTVWPRTGAGRRAVGQLAESGRTLSGREARSIGLVDHAFCDRRGKIELRTFLDRLESRGPRPHQSPEEFGLVEERQTFARSLGSPTAQVAIRQRQFDTLALCSDPFGGVGLSGHRPLNPIPPFPAVVGLVGENGDAARLLAEVALRGGNIVVKGSGSVVQTHIAISLARGFATPLEAEQARLRVKVSDTLAGFDQAGLVFVAEGETVDRLATVVGARCLVAMCEEANPSQRIRVDSPHSRRVVGLRLSPSAEMIAYPGTESHTLVTLAAWLKRLGLAVRMAALAAGSARAAA